MAPSVSLPLLLIILAAFTRTSGAATWCVCRGDVPEKDIQKTLDYSCGAGADCLPTHQKGVCFEPNTVISHCSYAANSFFQKNGQTAGSCDFSGTATTTNTDPSYGSCTYPASASDAGRVSTTPTTTTPTTTTTTPTSSTSMTPTNFTPTTGGVTGGVLGGIDPSGTGMTTDGTGMIDGGFSLLQTGKNTLIVTFFLSVFSLSILFLI